MDFKPVLNLHLMHSFTLLDRIPNEAAVVEKLEKELAAKDAALRDWHMSTTPIGVTTGVSSVLHCHEAEDEGEETEAGRNPGNDGDNAGR